MAYPESFREMGVSGSGGKEVEIGETLGEGGELPLLVELVAGRSLDLRYSAFDARKALNKGGLDAKLDALSPNEVELRLTNLAKEVVWAAPSKTAGFSDAKASNGYDSIA